MAESQLNHSQCHLRSNQYLGEISALCFSHLPSHLSSVPYLLAGSGSQVLLYDLESATMIQSFQVFQGIRVHGIICSLTRNALTYKLVVCGEKRVKLFNLSFELVSKSNPQSQPKFCVDLSLVHSLPRFSHWVLDVLLLKDHCLAIGCSDNSVHLWDILNSSLILQVQSPDRCLLYSMRLWGDNLEALRIASGTIYNEIIVWKVVYQRNSPSLTSPVEDCMNLSSSNPNFIKCHDQQHKAVNMCRLVGHEGSIFRIVWSCGGAKLVSVSDDRSARIWTIHVGQNNCDDKREVVGPVLFGHSARVWDCCVSDSLIITAGEDCTCRVWGPDGKQHRMIKEHIGRGIWRCLYDPDSSLLITAGFDSAIKVHQLHTSVYKTLNLEKDAESKHIIEGAQISTIRIPNSMDHAGLMDSIDDWIALGDGKGNMTVVGVTGGPSSPEVGFTFTWSAGAERQLLGTYWCKSLGCRYVFTTDPRGVLKLWRLYDPSLSVCHDSGRISIIAEFPSCFGIRIKCLDLSFEEELLVCGDLRGNLVLFPLSKDLLLCMSSISGVKISPRSYFKGAHGISSVSNISVVRLSCNQIEIRSTGADGCICYLDYDKDQESFEFVGMKQVKELSLIESVSADFTPADDLANCNYAAGFASTDFLIWNLITEAKVVQIPCGGWRRPHSYYLGDVPEMRNCFAYVKDEIIYIHRHWLPGSGKKIFPQNLHLQFHGREMHSLCFVYENLQVQATEAETLADKSSWIATGCEDGTVRLTRFTPEMENWSASKLLGEHVGGSAVRSICFVSKTHIIASDVSSLPGLEKGQNATSDSKQNPCLLVSVGAKRVLTSWLLRNGRLDEKEGIYASENHNGCVTGYESTVKQWSSLSFRWLSTDMPNKSPTGGRNNIVSTAKNVPSLNNEAKTSSIFPEKQETKSKTFLGNKYEDDWRYLAVTAFLVKCAGSRLTVSFVVVACSDATLALRALVLPHRLWFDVALLASVPLPVLALQHVVVPVHTPSKGNIQIGNLYIVISGATNGSIGFWDITESVETFVQRVSSLNIDQFIDCQKRPRTGRGSQGGRQWRSLNSSMSKKRFGGNSVTRTAGDAANSDLLYATCGTSSKLNDLEGSSKNCSQAMHKVLQLETSRIDSLLEICEIQPIHVMNNVHQSGVNCLHLSSMDYQGSENCFLFNIVSGGDDQALHYLRFKLTQSSMDLDTEILAPETIKSTLQSESIEKTVYYNSQNQTKNYHIRFFDHHRITSAHSSAIKGIWTDGTWVFSTGLDQRVRCWLVGEHGKLTEGAHLIISVPEPEALDARACGRNHYQIAVAGRGMQMVEFFAALQ
ncbi:uncharacterized protein LOC110413462 isoform X3 [Herrania umbratica]|uniref:Uncharacterized protein LOC110413462 isoform X3 n=1 Tax=Herrania umbratica TaxID=108875 RepID=A0A6J0ZZ40_9ROSI|nr:uncharacterized protein LOC110413462 isoform X3 [Herrania umbratica]